MDRHIILTNGRSGSNFLVNVLNQSQEVLNYGEVLGEWNLLRKLNRLGVIRAKDDGEFLDKIIYRARYIYPAQCYAVIKRFWNREPLNFKKIKAIKTVGIKDFSINFTRYRLENYLRERGDVKIVCLIRENTLRRFLSVLSLGNTGVAVSKQATGVSREKTLIDIPEMLKQLDILADEDRQLLELAKGVAEDRFTVIRYEDLFDGEKQSRVLENTFEFLGVSPISVVESHKKILPTKIEDIVSNYDEVSQALRETPYYRFLTT